MQTIWHEGMECICVKRYEHPNFENIVELDLEYPEIGEHYTVRTVEFDYYTGMFALRLHEIHNPVKKYIDCTGEKQWFAECFRPVVKKKTGFELLEEIRDRVNNHDLVDA